MGFIVNLVLLGAIGASAWLLVFGDKDQIGVAGVLLGALLGFVGGMIRERSQREHEDEHRFEKERRELYARFLGAVHDAEMAIDDC